MSNNTDNINQTIEYYKSEIVKKDEIIEKLFEEVDNLKDNQQELNEIIQKLQKKIHKPIEKEVETQLMELKIENERLKKENERLLKKERRKNHDYFYLTTEEVEDIKITDLKETEEIKSRKDFPIYNNIFSFAEKFEKGETATPENVKDDRTKAAEENYFFNESNVDHHHKRRAVYGSGRLAMFGNLYNTYQN
ncbi:hypothetical protein C1645_803501 [Glomus cerebriforme]|uniref:Uncharacterized protein n=1 Tax=Glomus cerebriforme TaxID=658196 RepID=A0A397THQ5_9GLOM|nr:hypothetical protein C1645_803501 [Glomus cerebriforme]